MSSPGPAIITTEPGAIIVIDACTFEIIQAIDLQKFLCKDVSNQQRCVVDFRRQKVSLPWQKEQDPSPTLVDLLACTEQQWEVARARRSMLEPFMKGKSRGDKTAETTAKRHGVSVATLYRWFELYRRSGWLLTSLIDNVRGGGRGKSRLEDAVDVIINTYIQDEFLSQQQPTIIEAHKEIKTRCKNAGLSPPALNTVKLRIGWIEESVKVEKRRGKEEASHRFEPRKSNIYHAEFPLQKAQMDHTPLPVIIVDDEHRLPLGRPNLTALIDCYSRVVLGYYLSLDDVCTESAGMCLAHTILTKDPWLQAKGIDHEWPFWGAPDVLQMDNAGEFRGDTLKLVCNEYDIDIEWRPCGRPNYGGHIESLMGTVSQKLKSLKGTTFSGITEKGTYDAEGNACLTFDELEHWLILMFTSYHIDKHSGIGMTPRQMWQRGLSGKAGILRSSPPIRTDVDKVRIDFLPIITRTIQNHGVEIDKVVYQDTVLHEFIGLKQQGTNLGVEYPFRRSDHDISEIMFFHPALKKYFTIPGNCEKVTRWQWQSARKALRVAGDVDDNSARHRLINEKNEIAETSFKKTKAMRKQQARLKNSAKASKSKPITENRKRTPDTSRPAYDRTKVVLLPDD